MSWLNKSWPAVLWCGVGKWPTLPLARLPCWWLMNMALIEFTEDKRVLIGRITMAAANYSGTGLQKGGGLLPSAGLFFPAGEWVGGWEGRSKREVLCSLLCFFSLGGSNKAIKSSGRWIPCVVTPCVLVGRGSLGGVLVTGNNCSQWLGLWV